MEEFLTKDLYSEGKVVWSTATDPEPDYYLVYSRGKFGLFATVSDDFTGQPTGKSCPLGEPFGYDEAYLSDMAPGKYPYCCYLALNNKQNWTLLPISPYSLPDPLIDGEPTFESLCQKLVERMGLGLNWINLRKVAFGPWTKSDYTPEKIMQLKPYQIFVFGSNLQGRHIGGAAAIACERFGAIWGQGVGLQGQSYAIPTMNLSLKEIEMHVRDFISFARNHDEYEFLVTRIGCGIAGFEDRDIAPLFEEAAFVDNISLPESFKEIIGKLLREEPY